MNDHESTDFPMKVIELEDGRIRIEWDANHPTTSVMNDWTEEYFLEVIMSYSENVLADKNLESSDESRDPE